MDKFASPENVSRVVSMFPEMSPVAVRKDLNRTRSVGRTINRILDGQVLSEGNSDTDSDEDLPEIPFLQRVKSKAVSTIPQPSILGGASVSSSGFAPAGGATEVIDVDQNLGSASSIFDVKTSKLSDRIQENDGVNIQGLGPDVILLTEEETSLCITKKDCLQNGGIKRPQAMVSHLDREDKESNSELYKCARRREFYSDSEHECETNLRDLPKENTRESQSSAYSLQEESQASSLTSEDFSQVSGYSVTQKPRKTATEKANQAQSLEERKADRQRKKQELEMKREVKRRQKEEEKAKKQQEREGKKRLKELEAARKRTFMEAKKQARPQNCMKVMTMIIDPNIVKNPCGAPLLAAVQQADIKVEIQAQVIPNLITLWREVVQVKDTGDKLETKKTEQVQDQVLLWLPVAEFVELVHAYHQNIQGLLPSSCPTLTSHVLSIRQALENRSVTLIVQGMDKYFREHKAQDRRDYRGKVQKVQSKGGRGKKGPSISTLVTRGEVEEALVDLQIQTNTNIRFVEADLDVAKAVVQYAKAVAETPFKKDRLTSMFSFHVDNSGRVRVDKDGHGLANLWRQQIQQFKLVSAEVANAIIACYPSPLLLYKAYKDCPSENEAELLLQNILVRRGCGVLETSRRVGKELSKKMYYLFTSQDSNFVIK